MFTVTPAAARELKAAADRSDAEGLSLRVAARRGDDGEVEYGMGFDEMRVDDLPLQFGDLTVLVGSPSRAILDDRVLDYVEGGSGQPAFVFLPAGPDAGAPAAPRGCGTGGCGSCSCA